MLLSIALYMLGVDYSVTKANTARVVGIRDSSAQAKGGAVLPVQAGDLILCNLTNVLEVRGANGHEVLFLISLQIILLQSVCSPVFLVPIRVEAPTNPPSISASVCTPHTTPTYLCIEYDFIAAVVACFSGPNGASVSADEAAKMSLRPLSACLQAARRKGVPAVLFVEGVRTNGCGVLTFPVEVRQGGRGEQ